MEVHHHPEVEKKGFKEYLLEGLMIFIAVMLGFIAENVRERISEHKRAKEYAETMVADLAADTAFMKDYRTYYDISAKHLDTLMQLLTSADIKSIPSGKMYWYGLFGGAFAYFTPNDATFQQMKSSGSIRYFDKSIAREVAGYDQLCRQMQTREENDRILYGEVRKLRAQIFEFQYNAQANELSHAHDPQNRDWKKINAFLTSNPPLLTYDKTVFNQYVELARSRFMERKVGAIDTLLKRNKTLMADLKRTYHIDN
ncbi:MAG: hypothetical protein JSU01_10565 [Bacteroidetes bacterium]|nr:hypothetical protein [Bacteroidota bacterium]